MTSMIADCASLAFIEDSLVSNVVNIWIIEKEQAQSCLQEYFINTFL